VIPGCTIVGMDRLPVCQMPGKLLELWRKDFEGREVYALRPGSRPDQ
jgi:hypothetical protein